MYVLSVEGHALLQTKKWIRPAQGMISHWKYGDLTVAIIFLQIGLYGSCSERNIKLII